MSKKGKRQIVFVCAATSAQHELITKIIPAASQNEAASFFMEQTALKAQEIMGPFYKKRAQVIETTRTLKFSAKICKAEYSDWLVDAHILKEPENHAYLVFIRRIDDKKQPAPKGTIIVPVSDLRFL
jgi:hypothetical protein